MDTEKYVPSKEVEAILDGYRLLDDTFMTMFFDQNFEATELVLNIILERQDIQVQSMEVQKMEKNASVDGRTAIMDIFAVDSTGKNYDIEIQRADSGAGRKRARFLSGVLDSRMLKSGDDFDSICDSYVIFITEKDVMGGDLPLYHVNRHIEEFENAPFADGNHIVYVNGAYKNDQSDIGKLMHDFRCTSSIDMFYPVLKDGMYHYKETEGGRINMCKAVEDYGKQRELAGKIEDAINLLAEGISVDIIVRCTGLPVDKVKSLQVSHQV